MRLNKRFLHCFQYLDNKLPNEEYDCEEIEKMIGNNLFFGVDEALCNFEEDIRDVMQPHDLRTESLQKKLSVKSVT